MKLIRLLAPLALFLLLTAQTPTPTAVPSGTPIGNLASPTSTPTAAPSANCQVQIQDLTAAPGKTSTTGTVAVPAASAHVLQIAISSPNALNSVTVNGTTPTGWGSLASGATYLFTVNTAGLWVFQVTNGNCISNSVSILGY